ncbi:MAG: CDP-alcohol phosphatidyltransferase family protein [Actinomycetota bacterium]|nr:CDP-alcohol phosphatidyltransferase family protein [Actinomycetota bacterium]
MFDGRWRASVDRATGPVGSAIRRTGITADQLTAVGLVMAVATAVAIGAGRLGLGLVLLGASALPDLLDGPVAKASGTAGPRGAFFDSVSDRVTDSLILGGIGWYLASEHGAHAAMLPFAVLGVSSLVSYQRAKAESLGYSAKGGLMERAERLIALSVGLAFSVILVPVLWLTLALTLVTAVQRFFKVWSLASVERPARPQRPGLDARWRAWRDLAAHQEHRSRRRGAWRARRHDRRRRRRAGTRP